MSLNALERDAGYGQDDVAAIGARGPDDPARIRRLKAAYERAAATHELAAGLHSEAATLHERHAAEIRENGWALNRGRAERLVRKERALAKKERLLAQHERSKALALNRDAAPVGVSSIV